MIKEEHEDSLCPNCGYELGIQETGDRIDQCCPECGRRCLTRVSRWDWRPCVWIRIPVIAMSFIGVISPALGVLSFGVSPPLFNADGRDALGLYVLIGAPFVVIACVFALVWCVRSKPWNSRVVAWTALGAVSAYLGNFALAFVAARLLWW